MLFDANRLNKNISHVYESEDAAELKEILGRGYHAVVGNPPYIAGDDPAAREAYRARYASCQALFTLVVPLMGRCFELARVRADDGHLIAGTDPNGLIYDISPDGKARVIYDSNLPEIRALTIAPDGTIYAAAMGGAVASRNASLPASAQSAAAAAPIPARWPPPAGRAGSARSAWT